MKTLALLSLLLWGCQSAPVPPVPSAVYLIDGLMDCTSNDGGMSFTSCTLNSGATLADLANQMTQGYSAVPE